MQTYIFLFTPRIRLDCTNEIKNWISCEEKKGNPLGGVPWPRLTHGWQRLPGTARLRAEPEQGSVEAALAVTPGTAG